MQSLIVNNNLFAQTCPLLLKDQQLENPYQFLEEFTSTFPLHHYQKALDTWFNAALHEKLKHPDPEALHYLHQQLQKLLNAWFLLVSQPSKANLIPSPYPDAKHRKKDKFPGAKNQRFKEHYQPYWLNHNDYQKPVDYLRTALTLANITHLRKGLQIWLECALAEHDCLADTHPSYGFELYQQLQQLLEASYFILHSPK